MSTKNLTNSPWQTRVKKIIKVEMLTHDISYEQLSELMRAAGIDESPGALKTKINRGTFSAAFMLQVLDVIGCKLSVERE